MTARARIREAAIARFGDIGFAATSVRDIATAAGVSPGMVIHHYGGKDELRRQCDDRVLEFLRAKSTATNGPSAMVARIGEYGPYLARMVTDGTDAGNALFDRILDESQAMIVAGTASGSIRTLGDSRLVALVLTIQSLAPLLLHAQFARFAGEDRVSAATLQALAVPTAEIYTGGLFTTDHLLSAVREAAGEAAP
ncbi:TetR family transcriptional regulator [soil metagenome]